LLLPLAKLIGAFVIPHRTRWSSTYCRLAGAGGGR